MQNKLYSTYYCLEFKCVQLMMISKWNRSRVTLCVWKHILPKSVSWINDVSITHHAMLVRCMHTNLEPANVPSLVSWWLWCLLLIVAHLLEHTVILSFRAKTIWFKKLFTEVFWLKIHKRHLHILLNLQKYLF